VLTGIQLHWQKHTPEAYPAPIPDLYAGEPLVVIVRGRHLGDQVRITGMRGGSSWHQNVSLRDGVAQAGIARLYARRKIDSLNLNANELRATLGREAVHQKLRSQIVKVGLKYHLVTRHTSLVAIERESSVPQGENLKAWPVPVNLPAGWELEEIWLERSEAVPAQAVFKMAQSATAEEKRKLSEKKKYSAKPKKAAQPGLQLALAQNLPQTATPAQLLMLLGVALLLGAVLLRRRVFARC
jgi:Ca-activated chloride channel family protein